MQAQNVKMSTDIVIQQGDLPYLDSLFDSDDPNVQVLTLEERVCDLVEEYVKMALADSPFEMTQMQAATLPNEYIVVSVAYEQPAGERGTFFDTLIEKVGIVAAYGPIICNAIDEAHRILKDAPAITSAFSGTSQVFDGLSQYQEVQ